jgi:SAM-dependent methyltransferase
VKIFVPCVRDIMKEEEKRATIKKYNERLKKYGYNPKTLGWFKGRQPVRFEILSQIGELNNCSILDIGCGFGDLYGFLTKKGLNIKYTGYDINPSLIKIAKEVYPEAFFEVKDVEGEEVNKVFDWVFSSGIFNFKLSDNESFIRSMLRKMFQLSKKGVAADFMSTYVDFKNKELYYTRPEDIFNFCKTLSKRVSLRHDYMPFEFCVYIYKNDRINEKNIFTEFDPCITNARRKDRKTID